MLKAQQLMKKDGKLDDYSSILEQAELWQDTDASAALKLYTKALEVLTQKGEQVPLEIYSNIGVAHHMVCFCCQLVICVSPSHSSSLLCS